MMKKFFEARIQLSFESETAEVIIARLSDSGFHGFIEEENHLLAYCEKGDVEASELITILRKSGADKVEILELEDKNWNEVWESEYEPVLIGDRVMVRAPFHKPVPAMEFDIIIEPKMSFGTAHHETTSLMLELISELDLDGESVLDMGCGTGVLAILAWMKGASAILAIDNDEWAWRNALENAMLNNAHSIKIEMGDAGNIGSHTFDIIFANINRNILLEDIPVYAAVIQKDGKLILSGFYGDDLQQIKQKCTSCGLSFTTSRMKNKWTAAVFTKN